MSDSAPSPSNSSSPTQFVYPGVDAEGSDDEEFVYPGAVEDALGTEAPGASATQTSQRAQLGALFDPDDEAFVYPGALEDVRGTASATQSSAYPSPAQLEALFAAASSGDLSLLKKLFQTSLQSGDVEAFALANDASTRTGFTALHAAASRGYSDMVQWCKWSCIFKAGI